MSRHKESFGELLLKSPWWVSVVLWLFSNGDWNEPLVLEIKDRTTISSSTTLPLDEPDYEATLTFMLSEANQLIGQFESKPR